MTDIRDSLVAWMHARQEFEYDQCDHGTYAGGTNHGKPYAMCERWADGLLDSRAYFDIRGDLAKEVLDLIDKNELNTNQMREALGIPGWIGTSMRAQDLAFKHIGLVFESVSYPSKNKTARPSLRTRRWKLDHMLWYSNGTILVNGSMYLKADTPVRQLFEGEY